MSSHDEALQGDENHEDLRKKELTKKILAGFSSKDRFLLIGRTIENLSFKELAEITGESVVMLQMKLGRLEYELRKQLGP